MAKNIVELAADIVVSFVSHSFVPTSELPDLLKTVHDALTRIESGLQVEAHRPGAREPMVSIRKSITPDYLICLDDGRKFKSLKRHLTQLGMTPAQYQRNGICRRTIRWLRPTTPQLDRHWRKKAGSGNCGRRRLARDGPNRRCCWSNPVRRQTGGDDVSARDAGSLISCRFRLVPHDRRTDEVRPELPFKELR